MDSFKELERKYFQAKEVHEVKKEITSYCCPICGSPLVGRIGEPQGDTLDFRAYIECNGCNMFHAESKHYSLYDKDNPEAKALKSVQNKVLKYIKAIGTPLEDVD